jgi:succinate dehydrogenase/fumarate reductase-like Fe-S protein
MRAAIAAEAELSRDLPARDRASGVGGSGGAGPVHVEPLKHFPILRDLIVDISDFLEKLTKAKPWLIREEEKPVVDGEYLQTPEQAETFRQFSMSGRIRNVLLGAK